MQPLKSVVGDVEDALASGEESRRSETLRQLTTLFIEQAPQLKSEHVDVYDEVILRLAHKIEFRARVELAERLSDVANAPLSTIKHLAYDQNAAIAGPVIERSPRLEESDLVQIAEQRGQSHLMAMARRVNLPESVTDVLVVRGDQKVLRTVAGNETAKFSDTGFGKLVERADADIELQSILQTRPDMPEHHIQAIMEMAKERARADLKDVAGSDDELVNALDLGAQEAMRDNGLVVLMSDVEAADKEIADLANRGLLVEEQVTKFIAEGKMPHALAALARIAQVPVDIVMTAYSAPHYDQMLFILRSQKFTWLSFKIFLNAKCGGSAPQSLLKSAYKSFETLTVPTSQRVLRFVVSRKKLGAAIAPAA